MLAADKLLLQSQLAQRTIELREKELNLFNTNFNSVGTQVREVEFIIKCCKPATNLLFQSAVLAGFSMTIFIETTIPEDANYYSKVVVFLCSFPLKPLLNNPCPS